MEKFYLRFQNKKILELEGCHADPNRVYTNPEEELEKGNAIKETDLPTNTRDEEIWLFNIVVISFKRIIVYFMKNSSTIAGNRVQLDN